MMRGRYFPDTSWLNIQAARVVRWRCLFGFPTKNAMKHSRKRRPCTSSVREFPRPDTSIVFSLSILPKRRLRLRRTRCRAKLYNRNMPGLRENRLYMHIMWRLLPCMYIMIYSQSTRSRKYNEKVFHHVILLSAICVAYHKNRTTYFRIYRTIYFYTLSTLYTFYKLSFFA